MDNEVAFMSLHIMNNSEVAAADMMMANGITVRKYIALADTLAALSAKFTTYKIQLPAGCIQYTLQNGMSTFLVIRPEHRRNLIMTTYESRDGGARSDIVKDVIIPQCLWKITLDLRGKSGVYETKVCVLHPDGLAALDATGNISAIAGYLLVMPFPNTSDTGICWGNMSTSKFCPTDGKIKYNTLDNIINAFWESIFNHDLGGMSINGHPIAKQKFVREYLAGKQRFPYELLSKISGSFGI
jgi:hypothetical protein